MQVFMFDTSFAKYHHYSSKKLKFIMQITPAIPLTKLFL